MPTIKWDACVSDPHGIDISRYLYVHQPGSYPESGGFMEASSLKHYQLLIPLLDPLLFFENEDVVVNFSKFKECYHLSNDKPEL